MTGSPNKKKGKGTMITLEDFLEICNDSNMIQLVGSDSQENLIPNPIPADELKDEIEENGFDEYLGASITDIVAGDYVLYVDIDEF